MDNQESINISILIPIYGVENYIEKCARSIFEQTLKNKIEFIFVDDCTPDKSIEILQSVIKDYPERESQVKIIKHKQNQGLASSRNTAVKNASGKYVYIIDSDDWLQQNNVLEQMLKTATDCDADIVEANYSKVSSNGCIKIVNKRNYKSKDKIIRDIICKRTPFTIWNKLIRKSLYSDHSITVPKGINNGEDYVTLPKLMFFANRIVKTDLYSYAYNQMNINSFASNRTNWKNLDSMIDANRHLKEFFKIYNQSYLRYIERMYLETKAYHLLYAQTKEELANVRQKFSACKYQYFISMRWKYQLVIILNALRSNRTILWIGQIFRRRGYANK